MDTRVYGWRRNCTGYYTQQVFLDLSALSLAIMMLVTGKGYQFFPGVGLEVQWRSIRLTFDINILQDHPSEKPFSLKMSGSLSFRL